MNLGVEAFRDWAFYLLDNYGMIGLFIVALIESSFFPVPPDVLLIALVGRMPQVAFKAGAVCTVGSVLGALLGYTIGLFGGRPIMLKLFKRSKVEAVETLYHEYGAWAVLIAAFTPIPYKVFTIASGVFRLSIPAMLVMSLIGRGARFFLVAYVMRFIGAAFVKQIDVVSLSVVLALAAIFVAIWLYRRKRATSALRATSSRGSNGEFQNG